MRELCARVKYLGDCGPWKLLKPPQTELLELRVEERAQDECVREACAEKSLSLYSSQKDERPCYPLDWLRAFLQSLLFEVLCLVGDESIGLLARVIVEARVEIERELAVLLAQKLQQTDDAIDRQPLVLELILVGVFVAVVVGFGQEHDVFIIQYPSDVWPALLVLIVNVQQANPGFDELLILSFEEVYKSWN